MEFQRATLIIGSLLLFPSQLASQEQAVLGQGNVLCNAWLDKHGDDDAQVAARTAWILGYITAYNQYGFKPEGDVSAGRGTQEIAAWIDEYCQQHPNDDVYRATAALVDEYRRKTGR